MTTDGPIGARIRSLGVPVQVLNLNARQPNPVDIIQLARWLKKARPDLVQTWMYHANVIGGLATKLADRKLPVIWNVRASNLDPAVFGRARRHGRDVECGIDTMDIGTFAEQEKVRALAAAVQMIENRIRDELATIWRIGLDHLDSRGEARCARACCCPLRHRIHERSERDAPA